MSVYQSITPREVRVRMAEYNASQMVVAEFAGIDNTQLSFFMNGRRGLSTKAQSQLYRVFDFFEEVRGETDLPVDFCNVVALRGRWERWCAAREESAVVRTKGE